MDAEKDEFEHILMEDDPVDFHQVMESANSQQWLEAMNKEMQTMKDNDVWDLVALRKGKKPISNKWIFKTKKDSNGNVERFKARLVVQGFTQKQGIDYKETFSSKDSLRIIMELVAHFDLELHQMDVKTTFLNGNIDETIYMKQPENFAVGDPKKMVYKLKKSIYGLKQTSRQWYLKFQRPLKLYCDNDFAVKFSNNNKSSRKSKFVALKFLVVKEKVQHKELLVKHISTNFMIADPLTKALPPKRFLEHVAHMSVVSSTEDVQFMWEFVNSIY